MDASPEQVRAWDQSIPWLQRECRELEVRDTAAHEYTAILEYELPRDSRRPDVIVLERGCVAVLELKGPSRFSGRSRPGARLRARPIRLSRSVRRSSRDPRLAGSAEARRQHSGTVYSSLGPKVWSLCWNSCPLPANSIISVRDFPAPDAYAPLPTIVQAARELFHKRELPMIKRARAATDPALQYISDIAREAARTKVTASGVAKRCSGVWQDTGGTAIGALSLDRRPVGASG